MDSFKCNTGGCIPQKYLCDGQPHCPDFSDEWNCFGISKIDIRKYSNENQSIEEYIEKNNNFIDPINTGTIFSLLNIKRNNSKLHFVCDDNWNKNYSDFICSKLGFSESYTWSEIALTVNSINTKFLKIRNSSSLNENLLNNLDVTDSCTKGIVGLECVEYRK